MIFGYYPLVAEPIGAGTKQVSYIVNDSAELTSYFFEVVVTPDGTVLIPGGVDYIFDNEVASLTAGGFSYQVFEEIDTITNTIFGQSVDIEIYEFVDTSALTLTVKSADSPILYKIDLGLPLGMFSFDPIGGEQIVPLNEIDIAVKVISANSIDNYIFNGVDEAELRTTINDFVLRTFGYISETLELEITVNTAQRSYTFLANINIDDVGQLRWNVEPDTMYIANTKVVEANQFWIG